MKIAIIGAGMAGLACARALEGNGHEIRVFDKGRGPGGRMSTRRMQTPVGEVRWDHGAQFFTARDAGFASAVQDWVQAGAVKVWDGKFLELGAPARGDQQASDVRYVGAPGMNGVIRHLTDGLQIDWARRTAAISGTPGTWTLQFEDESTEGPFEIVVVAVPAEQAAPLLKPPAPLLSQMAERVVSAPCWAVLLAYREPLDAGFDAARIANAPLSWIARNTSKPGRGTEEAWVLHASPDWSRENVDEQAEEVAARLIRNFRAMSGAPDPVFSAAHRWLYAMVEEGAGAPYGWNAQQGIGSCGDWHIAPRVEAAWVSGTSLATEILETT